MYYLFMYGLLLAPLLLYNSNTTSRYLQKENIVVTLSFARGYPQHLTLQKIWN
jgi:hypothetical protein